MTDRQTDNISVNNFCINLDSIRFNFDPSDMDRNIMKIDGIIDTITRIQPS